MTFNYRRTRILIGIFLVIAFAAAFGLPVIMRIISANDLSSYCAERTSRPVTGTLNFIAKGDDVGTRLTGDTLNFAGCEYINDAGYSALTFRDEQNIHFTFNQNNVADGEWQNQMRYDATTRNLGFDYGGNGNGNNQS